MVPFVTWFLIIQYDVDSVGHGDLRVPVSDRGELVYLEVVMVICGCICCPRRNGVGSHYFLEVQVRVNEEREVPVFCLIFCYPHEPKMCQLLWFQEQLVTLTPLLRVTALSSIHEEFRVQV